MQVQDGNINIIQQFRIILDLVTTGEEHDTLLLQVPLQKGEQQQEPLVGFTDDIALFQHCRGGSFFIGIDVDVEGTGTEGDSGKVFDFGGLGCGEEHGLAVFCASVRAYERREQTKETTKRQINTPSFPSDPQPNGTRLTIR
jgi:hypothetical protein